MGKCRLFTGHLFTLQSLQVSDQGQTSSACLWTRCSPIYPCRCLSMCLSPCGKSAVSFFKIMGNFAQWKWMIVLGQHIEHIHLHISPHQWPWDCGNIETLSPFLAFESETSHNEALTLKSKLSQFLILILLCLFSLYSCFPPLLSNQPLSLCFYCFHANYLNVLCLAGPLKFHFFQWCWDGHGISVFPGF